LGKALLTFVFVAMVSPLNAEDLFWMERLEAL
jgi:hypothetical protein